MSMFNKRKPLEPLTAKLRLDDIAFRSAIEDVNMYGVQSAHYDDEEAMAYLAEALKRQGIA